MILLLDSVGKVLTANRVFTASVSLYQPDTVTGVGILLDKIFGQ